MRQASEAMLDYGLFGPPPSAVPDPHRRAARGALWAGAALRLELIRLATGVQVPTVFVNLVEAPEDRGVIVVARFLDDPARVPAPLPSVAASGRDQADAAS